MQFFADDRTVQALDLECAGDAGKTSELAWYLRQAETQRAGRLANEASRAADADAGTRSRAVLVRAEAAIHQGLFDAAQSALGEAGDFAHDPAGRADSKLVAALLAQARGQPTAALALADAVAADAPADRADIAAAYAAMVSVYADPPSALLRLAAVESRALGPEAQVFAATARSLHEFNRGDHAAAIRMLEPVAQLAATLGMLQMRLRVQNSIAAAYSNLDDKESAIRWVEESLELARAAGWPIATGEALSFLGNFYRESGHAARALETLVEAREVLRVAPRSRGYALACCYLAHAELAAGNLDRALESAREARDAAAAINATPIVVDVLTLAARAQARLGDAVEGARLAAEALALATEGGLGVWQVDALRALAEIHGEHEVPAPEGVPPAVASLHFLERARAVVATLSGHAENVSILRELARAHERSGNLAAALEAERAAIALALSEESRRVGNRLLAVQARHQLEQRRLEAEHQRQIAQAEAERAAVLARANIELERIASTDSLTGIANRRAFLAAAEEEVQRGLRYGRPLGFIIADIDRFKAINDSRGHPCGDRVIVAAALALDGARRGADRVGRLGGEEFGVLLPEADLATARAAAERLRIAVAQVALEWDGEAVPFTMSFGVAALDGSARAASEAKAALDDLIRRADGALYEAKLAGRNAVRG